MVRLVPVTRFLEMNGFARPGTETAPAISRPFLRKSLLYIFKNSPF
jgi:hypothetical protein